MGSRPPKFSRNKGWSNRPIQRYVVRYDGARNETALDCPTLSICTKKLSFSENQNFLKNPHISWAIDPKIFQEIKGFQTGLFTDI